MLSPPLSDSSPRGQDKEEDNGSPNTTGSPNLSTPRQRRRTLCPSESQDVFPIDAEAKRRSSAPSGRGVSSPSGTSPVLAPTVVIDRQSGLGNPPNSSSKSGTMTVTKTDGHSSGTSSASEDDQTATYRPPTTGAPSTSPQHKLKRHTDSPVDSSSNLSVDASLGGLDSMASSLQVSLDTEVGPNEGPLLLNRGRHHRPSSIMSNDGGTGSSYAELGGIEMMGTSPANPSDESTLAPSPRSSTALLTEGEERDYEFTTATELLSPNSEAEAVPIEVVPPSGGGTFSPPPTQAGGISSVNHADEVPASSNGEADDKPPKQHLARPVPWRPLRPDVVHSMEEEKEPLRKKHAGGGSRDYGGEQLYTPPSSLNTSFDDNAGSSSDRQSRPSGSSVNSGSQPQSQQRVLAFSAEQQPQQRVVPIPAEAEKTILPSSHSRPTTGLEDKEEQEQSVRRRLVLEGEGPSKSSSRSGEDGKQHNKQRPSPLSAAKKKITITDEGCFTAAASPAGSGGGATMEIASEAIQPAALSSSSAATTGKSGGSPDAGLLPSGAQQQGLVSSGDFSETQSNTFVEHSSGSLLVSPLQHAQQSGPPRDHNHHSVYVGIMASPGARERIGESSDGDRGEEEEDEEEETTDGDAGGDRAPWDVEGSFDDQLLQMFIDEQKDQYGADRPVGDILEALEQRVTRVIGKAAEVSPGAGRAAAHATNHGNEINPIDEAILSRRCAKTVDAPMVGFRPLVPIHPEPLLTPKPGFSGGHSYGDFLDDLSLDLSDEEEGQNVNEEDLAAIAAQRNISPQMTPLGRTMSGTFAGSSTLRGLAEAEGSTERKDSASSVSLSATGRPQQQRGSSKDSSQGQQATNRTASTNNQQSSAAHRRRVRHFLFTLGMYYYLIPLVFVLLVILIYYFGPLKVCNIACSCDVGPSFAYTMSYGLLLNLPRCLFMGALCEVLIYAAEYTGTQRPRWDVIGVVDLFKTRRLMTFVSLGATLLHLLVVGPAAALDLPAYVFRPIVVIVSVGPFAIYALTRKAPHVAGIVTVVHLLPIIYGFLASELIQTSPAGVVAIWPLMVALLDRVFMKIVYFLSPTNRTPFAIKLVLCHSVAFYAQGSMAAVLVAIDVEQSPALVIMYVLLSVSVECLLSTRFVENFWDWVTRKLQESSTSSAGHTQLQSSTSVQSSAVPVTDFTRLAPQTRCLSGWLAVVLLVPPLAFERFPDSSSRGSCEGVSNVFPIHWATWLLSLFSVTFAFVLTSTHRLVRRKFHLPLGLLSPSWSVLTCLYFSTMAINAAGLVESGLG